MFAAVLTYRVIAFWLPIPPGIVAFFQLRKTVNRWEEEGRERPERIGVREPETAAAGLVTNGGLGATIKSEVKPPERSFHRGVWVGSERTEMSEKTNGSEKVENLIIVGGGPAGYTAALYAARAELEPLVIEGFQWGGQLQNTTDVENYPGYQEGVMGPEMMNDFRAQAERFGTRFITDDATEIELTDGGVQTVKVGKDTYRAKAVILSMGAEPKRLGIPGEIELGGRGVSTCGVCDGAFFKGEDVAVIGGGDSAMEDSIFVSKFAKKLMIDPPPRRVPRLQDHAGARSRQGEHRVPDAVRPGRVRRRRRRQDRQDPRSQHAETGEEKEIDVGGAFVAIGHRPRSELVKGQVELDDEGYVVVEEPSTKTKLAGRLRGRRPRRPHLPPGGHRRRQRHQGRPRRGVVPPRHAAGPRGALGHQHRRHRRGGRGFLAAAI